MGNIIVLGIIVLIVGLSVYKIVRDKKNNVKCSGCSACPMNSNCNTHHSK